MAKYESIDAFAGKASWEGGLDSLFLDYGVDPNEVEHLGKPFFLVVARANEAAAEFEAALNDVRDFFSEEWDGEV